MSGAELALAIVPLVIVLVEHHRTVFEKGKALALSKISNDQQLDFYQELHGELTLLNMILERVQIKSIRTGTSGARPEKFQAASIDIALGNSAEDFKFILDRVLKSINDLVREKSNALAQKDTVRAMQANTLILVPYRLTSSEHSARYASKAPSPRGKDQERRSI
jgi:hypothetical protein